MGNIGRVYILVSGYVQGVLYRSSTAEKARGLGLTGWVKNTSDGGVEITAEGNKESLERLVEWCWQGPGFAKVKSVEVGWEKYTEEFKSFEVRL